MDVLNSENCRKQMFERVVIAEAELWVLAGVKSGYLSMSRLQ